MTNSRNKLYTILFTACVAGYIWLFFTTSNSFVDTKIFDGCLVKNITNIPCPSCGSTRSIVALIKGNFFEAITTNPVGILVALIMILTPLWIVADIVTRKQTLFDFYQIIETKLKTPQYAIPLILLVVINWIWNITKGL